MELETLLTYLSSPEGSGLDRSLFGRRPQRPPGHQQLLMDIELVLVEVGKVAVRNIAGLLVLLLRVDQVRRTGARSVVTVASLLLFAVCFEV